MWCNKSSKIQNQCFKIHRIIWLRNCIFSFFLLNVKTINVWHTTKAAEPQMVLFCPPSKRIIKGQKSSDCFTNRDARDLSNFLWQNSPTDVSSVNGIIRVFFFISFYYCMFLPPFFSTSISVWNLKGDINILCWMENGQQRRSRDPIFLLTHSHCSKSSFCVQKFNFDFQRKIVQKIAGGKTR